MVLRSLKIKRLIEIQNFELVEFFSVVIYQRIIYCEESKLDIIIGKKTFTLSTEKQKQNKTNISPLNDKKAILVSNFFDEELWRDVYEGPNAQEIVGSSDQSKKGYFWLIAIKSELRNFSRKTD